MEQPQHQHDCDVCVFLGTHEHYDLYYCPHHEDPGVAATIIARYGEAGKYKSGNVFSYHPFTHSLKNPLYVARKRAEKLGIKVPKDMM